MFSCFAFSFALLLLALLLAREATAGGFGRGPNGRALRKRQWPPPEERRYFNHQPARRLAPEELPKSFSWANVSGIPGLEGTSLLTPSWNEHIPQYCGSCYAHAALQMVQDRISVATRGRSRVMLGRQTFLNCAPLRGMGYGCDGGVAIDVFEYMERWGLPDETCMPYTATDDTDLPPAPEGLTLEQHHCAACNLCRNCMPKRDDPKVTYCWAVKRPILYHVSSHGVVGELKDVAESVAQMKSEIYQRGPIVCAMADDDKFVYDYDGSIWNDTSLTADDVNHDVEVVGWGEEDEVEFWHLRNSWGTYWGKVGFFRVQLGINAMLIEDGYCWYALPDISMEQAVEEGEYIGSMDGLQPLRKGANAEASWTSRR